MNTPRRFVLIACVVSLSMLAFEGPFVGTRSVVAQGFSRGPSEGRSWGSNRGGESGGWGRDRRERSRDGDRHDGERRGDDRSSGGSDGKPSSPTPTPSSTESKPADASASASTEKWARDFVTEHDKNGNKWLDGDEKKDLHGRAAESDANSDGVITVEELIAKLTSSAPATTASTTSSGSTGSSGGGDSDRRHRDDRRGDSDNAQRVYTGSAGGLASKSKEGDKRHSYRFSTAAARLPSGLPSFFSRDTNGDGQISMSEYSRTWSKSTVGEFRKYDVNDDGIITAKEAVKPASGG